MPGRELPQPACRSAPPPLPELVHHVPLLLHHTPRLPPARLSFPKLREGILRLSSRLCTKPLQRVSGDQAQGEARPAEKEKTRTASVRWELSQQWAEVSRWQGDSFGTRLLLLSVISSLIFLPQTHLGFPSLLKCSFTNRRNHLTHQRMGQKNVTATFRIFHLEIFCQLTP